MRKTMLLAAAAAVSFATLWTASSPAMAFGYKYCLQGRQWGYPGRCEFSTYRQCLATASGTASACGVNPAYAYGYQGRYRY
ncbi:MAG TPA: DUF3551 domain-containing protein [Bradyrhizobium sp.]|jgi:hypothetical protein